MPPAPSVSHPHPAAPAEIKNQFSEFLKKIEASVKTSSTTPASAGVLKNFWEAPERLWKQDIEEAEIEAILDTKTSRILKPQSCVKEKSQK
ncbi:hypothetical protein C0995_007955 [Termitomyces sp. Mi166|nr:hypothetical protein C0995_007955 [Termitomyces sp. Mi166\